MKQSRKEMAKAEKEATKEARKLAKGKEPLLTDNNPTPGWIGEGTVPAFQYPDLSKPPVLPPRPSFFARESSESMNQRSKSFPQTNPSPLPAPPTLPVPAKHNSRSPSPDHKQKKTMLTTLRTGDRRSSKPRTMRVGSQRPTPLKAAGMAWDTSSRVSSAQIAQSLQTQSQHDHTIPSRLEATAARRSLDLLRVASSEDELKGGNIGLVSDPGDYIPSSNWRDMQEASPIPLQEQLENLGLDSGRDSRVDPQEPDVAPPPPPHDYLERSSDARPSPRIPPKLTKPPDISYRNEFPPSTLKPIPPSIASTISSNARPKSPEKIRAPAPPMPRKPMPNSPASRTDRTRRLRSQTETSSGSGEESTARNHKQSTGTVKSRRSRPKNRRESPNHSPTPPSSSEATTTEDQEERSSSSTTEFERRKAALLSNLPKNVDLPTATQILNEVIIHGDEVHWSDVAGLEPAKKALKEAVVYPFLRPDLFMGLREPARGMLLFGPPGTGKTMLARAVATESKSTFFAISASSLTSKWHGESEKLVRALFAIARRLAPSIIFVDEIDSLLGSRGGSGGSEHEASRRSKTEFLIQWSDLQKAAAGSKDKEGKAGEPQGDPTRVLVLAATNMPWDIDEAARRRFVRRQYIPLPEAQTREVQIRTLLGHQNHGLSDDDIEVLVQVTEGTQPKFAPFPVASLSSLITAMIPPKLTTPTGFSGSDITALAKDAAMGPLRNLGEALLYTPMDQIRPITFKDFEASLDNIRPSVSKAGLREYEDWAREFGERGG
jgi:fidgetin-like protein 1